MEKLNVNTLFKEAEEELSQAREELYRPIEDVVAFSACVSTRKALYKYLLGLSKVHAEEHGESLKEFSTIEELIQYNSKYSKALKEVDFSLLDCKCKEISEEEGEDLQYCTNVKKVSYCSGLSDQVREILVQKKPSLVQN